MTTPVGRVARGIREIDWVGAVGELTLIVVGILVALWVNAFVEGQGERRSERESLQLLDRDLTEAIAQLEEFGRVVDGTGEAGLRDYEALSGSFAEIDQTSISDDLLRLVNRRTVRLPRASYTDLLSTGNIRLVRNAALRDRVIQFYERVERVETIIGLTNTNAIDRGINTLLWGGGLIIPRPLPVGYPLADSASARVRNAFGEDFEHPPDPIWDLAASSPVWDQVRTRALHLARASSTQRLLADEALQEARELQTEIRAHLNR